MFEFLSLKSRMNTAAANDRSVSTKEANLFALVLMIPILLIAAFVYPTVLTRGLVFTGVMLVLIALHELIHALTLKVLIGSQCGKVSFRLHLRTLTPYVHISGPMSLREYRLVTVMPFISLGSGTLFFYSTWMIVAALGDLLVLYLLRKDDPDTQVIDHPSRAGCTIVSLCKT